MSSSQSQSWAKISVPVSGTAAEAVVIELAAAIASAFSARLNLLFTPPDPAELAPWLGEGFMGAVQVSTLEGLATAAHDALELVSAQFDALPFNHKALIKLNSPVWQDLAIESRLSDLVVFGDASARGRGLLAEAFQQVLMEERAGVFIARKPMSFNGTALVAWDGKEPSSRAARRSVPLLKKASKVVVVGAPTGDNAPDLLRLADYYELHGITAEVDILPKGDIVALLIDANQRHSADYMVAGAFGRSRLREFAFGGTTRALLQSTDLNLYMAH